MSKLILAISAMVISMGVGGGAVAQELHTVTGRIPYVEQDLATSSGAHVMLRRIERTADSLCASATLPVYWPQPVQADVDRCRSGAVSRAVADLQAPLVTVEYEQSQNRP
jgi:UrcA family protein